MALSAKSVVIFRMTSLQDLLKMHLYMVLRVADISTCMLHDVHLLLLLIINQVTHPCLWCRGGSWVGQQCQRARYNRHGHQIQIQIDGSAHSKSVGADTDPDRSECWTSIILDGILQDIHAFGHVHFAN
jgi:hypothetical protein